MSTTRKKHSAAFKAQAIVKFEIRLTEKLFNYQIFNFFKEQLCVFSRHKKY